MGVLMQAFYWNCPEREKRDGQWWNYVATKVPEMQAAGFTALWLPPASKSANLGGPSMGYDPYDYYDLGDFNQKGRVKTWFGNQAELTALIAAAHAAGMQVYADFVSNHNSGADAEEVNPLTKQSRWTKYSPLSGRFPRDWKSFHPSPYETFDGMTFGDMPDLCHRNPRVYTGMIEHAQWLVEEIGFDGFRFDFVKGYGPWMVKAIAEVRYLGKSGPGLKPFCVGECWDNVRTIEDWLTSVNTFMDNPISAFDFPLRYRLKDLCDTFGFSLKTLAQPGTLLAERPEQAVTFVDNHDTTQEESNGVIHDKLLAYSYILTHEGYPSVFWLDYFNHGLARSGTAHGIEALVAAHEKYAGGSTNILFLSDDLYIMQRPGHDAQPGLIYVLNNRGDAWGGADVQTKWANTRFVPVAWDGGSQAEPHVKWTNQQGRGDFWAPPRGYAVYRPDH
ncbi:MAG: alpha-amylase family glycosyl hydrolase [Acidobacteria bacterium]|nr:alpha-amylase family glycosyl hydrolase [Acidobacteriota bacterium]